MLEGCRTFLDHPERVETLHEWIARLDDGKGGAA